MTTQDQQAAAFFDAMLAKLHQNHHVPNLDMMTMVSFCRNCMSNHLVTAAKMQSVVLDKEDAKSVIYGMSYDDWWDLNHPPKTAS
jgi:uncharacterized protein